jgi:hypothetical protein
VVSIGGRSELGWDSRNTYYKLNVLQMEYKCIKKFNTLDFSDSGVVIGIPIA